VFVVALGHAGSQGAAQQFAHQRQAVALVRAEGQQRAERRHDAVAGVARRSALVVDQAAFGDQLPLVVGNPGLALGDDAGREVQDHRRPAWQRHTRAEGVRAEARIGAAVWRHDGPRHDVDQVQRDQALGCRLFGPGADAAQMMGVAQGDDAAAVPARPLGGQRHGFMADHLAKARVPVQPQQRPAVEQGADVRVRDQPTFEERLGIARQHADAVRIVAREVGLDEVRRHRLDFVFAAAEAAHHESDGLVQALQGNAVVIAHSGLPRWHRGAAILDCTTSQRMETSHDLRPSQRAARHCSGPDRAGRGHGRRPDRQRITEHRAGPGNEHHIQHGSWPNKPIRYIVPFAAGGTTDILARVVGEKLGAALGQTIVVDNKPGQGGSAGAAELARSAPDGYTIGGGTISSHAINATLYDKLPYDPVTSFAPITLYATHPTCCCCTPACRPTTCASSSRCSRPNPEKYNFGSAGNGTSQHISGELFKTLAGVKMQHVPYRGSGQMIPELLGGTLTVAVDNIATSLPHIKAGKLKALAVTTAQRSGVAPDVPTMAESGLTGYELSSWQAVFAPAGTPPAIVERLYTEIAKILKMPDVAKRLTDLGLDLSGMPPAQLAALIKADVPRLGKVVKESGAKPE
jgi:tripartite-type tricarboxylate transporter receptor subunit TctC